MTIRELNILVEKYNISKDKPLCFVHINEHEHIKELHPFIINNIDENNIFIILDDCSIKNKLKL